MASSCLRGQVKWRGRCLKKCKSGQSRSRVTSRCRKTAQRSKAKRALRKKSTPRRTRTRARRTTTRRTKTRAKTRKPTKRQLRNSRGLAAFINHLEGRRVVKVSARGGVRPSAGQAWRDGAKVGTKVCYDGKCRRLRLDKNKRPYWGKL